MVKRKKKHYSKHHFLSRTSILGVFATTNHKRAFWLEWCSLDTDWCFGFSTHMDFAPPELGLVRRARGCFPSCLVLRGSLPRALRLVLGILKISLNQLRQCRSPAKPCKAVQPRLCEAHRSALQSLPEFHPSPKLTCNEIVWVRFVGIGFFLKGNVPVSIRMRVTSSSIMEVIRPIEEVKK